MLDLTARACVLMSHCHRGVSIASCANEFLVMTYPDRGAATREVSLRLIQCGQATTCDAFRSCEIGGRPVDYCTAHPAGSCDGDTLVFCGTAYALALPCSDYGVHCRTDGTTSTCTSGETCVDAAHGSECADNRLVYCTANSGTPSGLDCTLGLAGGVCATDSTGATCVSSTPCTNASSSPRCDGNVAASCSNGHDRRIDCALANHGHCVLPVNPGAHTLEDLCIPDDAVCDPSTAADRCSGPSIEACVAGRWIDVDCRSVGFTTCRDNGTSARCIP